MNSKKLNFFGLAGAVFFVSVFSVAGFVYVQAATNVSTSTQTITLNDSDGDGLLDKDDPHPDIPEIYIVEDKNLNGVVDLIEFGVFYDSQQEDSAIDISNQSDNVESSAVNNINNDFNLEDLYYGGEDDD